MNTEELIAKAAAWDKAQAARSAGGKKAAQNMTEKARKKRAIKAAKARWKYIKARKDQNETTQ